MATIYGKVAIGEFDDSFGFGFDGYEGAVCTATLSSSSIVIKIHYGAADISGSATLSGNMVGTITVSAPVSASATLSSNATIPVPGASSISASTTLSSNIVGDLSAAAAISTSATLSGNMVGTITAPIVFSAVATLTTESATVQFGASAMSASATLSTASNLAVSGKAATSSSSTLSSNMTGVITASAALSVAASLAASALSTKTVSAGTVDIGGGGDVLYVPTTTETDIKTAGSSFTDVASISASEFTGGATYLILCSANVGNGSSTSALNYFKTVHGSAGFTGSTKVVESHNISEPSDVYGYMTKFTQPATPEDIKFQFKGTNAKADSVSIIAIPLGGLIENTDYFFDEDDDSVSPTSHGTTYSDYASVSFTPTNNNDDWLVIANPTVRIDSTASNYVYGIRHNTEDRPYFSHEGEDLGESATAILSRAYTLSNSTSHTFAVQGKDDETGINDHYASRIFVLRLNAMRDYAFTWTQGRQVHSEDAFESIANVSITPTSNSKALVIGYARHDTDSENDTVKSKLTVDGYAKPTGADGLVNVARDSTDERSIVRLGYANLSAYESHDVNSYVSLSGGTHTYDHSLCVVSLALEGVPAGAEITANGTIDRNAATIVTGPATLTASGIISSIFGVASLSGSATTLVRGRMTTVAASAMTSSATVTVGSFLSHNVPIITGPSTLTAVARFGVAGKTSIETSSTLSGAAKFDAAGKISATVSATLSPSGKQKLRGQISVSGSGSLSVGSVTEIGSEVNISSSGALSAGHIFDMAGIADIQSTVNIAGNGVLSLRGICPASLSATLVSNGIIAITEVDNDIVSITTYIDQSTDIVLYIDEGISPSLYTDQELAVSLER